MKKSRAYIIIACAIVAAAAAIIVIKHNQNKADKKDYVKVGIEEAFDVSELEGKEYDNLKFPEHISINKPEAVYTGKIYCPDYTELNSSKQVNVFKKMIQTGNIDKKFNSDNIVESSKWYPYGAMYEDDEVYISMGCTGFFTSYIGEDRYGINEDYTIIKTYDLESDYEDDVYELSEGKISISDAQKLADEHANEYMKMLGYDGKFKAVVIEILENEKVGKFCRAIYQNVIYDTGTVNVVNEYHNDGDIEYAPLLGNECYIYGAKEQNVRFTTFNQVVLPYQEPDNIENMISVSDAVLLLHNKLSSEKKYTVRSVGIEYMTKNTDFIDKDGKGKKHYDVIGEQGIAGWGASYQVGNYWPCWAFHIDLGYRKEIVGYVDCVTGEIVFVYNQ